MAAEDESAEFNAIFGETISHKRLKKAGPSFTDILYCTINILRTGYENDKILVNMIRAAIKKEIRITKNHEN